MVSSVPQARGRGAESFRYFLKTHSKEVSVPQMIQSSVAYVLDLTLC
jgi:hypothetical protein